MAAVLRHAYPLKVLSAPVVDTTAAGDAYVAALACALAEGVDPLAAARFATSAAALAVGVSGTPDNLTMSAW